MIVDEKNIRPEDIPQGTLIWVKNETDNNWKLRTFRGFGDGYCICNVPIEKAGIVALVHYKFFGGLAENLPVDMIEITKSINTLIKVTNGVFDCADCPVGGEFCGEHFTSCPSTWIGLSGGDKK